MEIERNERYANAIQEEMEYQQINGNPEATEDDAFEALMGECGLGPNGACRLAGSEYCDFECPFA